MLEEFELMCILDYIQENLVDGELPRDFNLPIEWTKNSLPYADGAKDGIAVYHTYPSGMAEESLPFLDEMLRAISTEDYSIALNSLSKFAEKNSPIYVFHDFQEYIVNQDRLEPEKLFDFTLGCLLNTDIDIIKYGLLITALFPNPMAVAKNVIMTLGLCNEFTIYAIFNILHWSNANDIIFMLAQKVHGWGRIHAVSYLQPENDEIKKWLLEEGIHNDILPEYTEEEVRRKFMDES